MEDYIPHPQGINREAAMNPRVVTIMMELQSYYNLPIEIVCGKYLNGLRMVKLRLQSDDEEILDWFIETAEKLQELSKDVAFAKAEEL